MPYSGAQAVVRALKRAPTRELLTFDGGRPAISLPCEPKSQHGYLGIEPAVVSALAAWIRAH